MDAAIAPIRFRANVYFDVAKRLGASTIGSALEIALRGAARLRVVSPITRCASTQDNPITAARELYIPDAHDRNFDHNKLVIYADVLSAGEVALGDALLAPPDDTGRSAEK